MIDLKFPTEPVWLDLPMGVRVQVRPYRAAILNAARVYAGRVLEALAKAEADRREAGLPPSPDDAGLDDPDMRAGLSEMLVHKGIARHAIIAWEGVGGEASPENFGRLMESPVFAGPFMDKYLALRTILDAEGNASAPAPNGTSAAGAPIATAAGSEATPAAGVSQP